ncbi:CHAT domain-containing protein [Longimicrobium terrae]|uniref:TPR repeat protein n=1 Tax=Longimicrobium terrae TaxID=1639882 RepID=A0A841H2L8_9BACT|nr:CHAT domain-containing protein [Longimicrobium terrae]MBB4637804.1 TPR repeat protein [Longimicrobium terrae]MBB6072341.1 TPR repeat protein [Longimicrobium terrae]NNC31260.1 CHAT domain-containing protein [Longimicrobium terrae]
MKKITVLFLAADPGATLRLDEDVRETQQRIKVDRTEAVMDFQWRPAARPSDLANELRTTRPRIVHFSGHGNEGVLVFASPDGLDKRRVSTVAMTRAFQVFKNEVRLVVLSACYSRSQAEAVAQVVGCAIGTTGEILDEDAIRFNAEFYGAIASGESVQMAFDQARTVLELNEPGPILPELVHRADVDPARLFLQPRFRREKRYAAIASAALTAIILATSWPVRDQPPPDVPVAFQVMDCGTASTTGGSGNLEAGKTLCAKGRYEAAFRLFQKSAAAGEPEALGLLGWAYLSGRGTPVDSVRGAELVKQGADKGDIRSMIAWAAVHQNGYGVQGRSPHFARHWLHRAIDEGHSAEAMRRLGVIFAETGSDSAVHYLTMAGQAGSHDAHVDLGDLYLEGKLVTADTTRAVHEYLTAARARSVRGMYALGLAYQTGLGVPVKLDAAHTLLREAACAGSADARYALGAQYLDGAGVPADTSMAARWLHTAWDAGSRAAQGTLQQLGMLERPLRWRGPVGWVLARLGLSGTGLPERCPANSAIAH